MKAIRDLVDKQKERFKKDGKYTNMYRAFEALETFLFVPNHTTPAKGVQIRDANDLKRMMMTVIIAMVPCLLFGMWNAGHQHYLAIGQEADFLTKFLLGAQLVIPIVAVAYIVGLATDFASCVIRNHAVNEGYLVSGMLIPLIMPVTIPLWQVAIATVFAVIIAREVFGGTGMNVLNVALTARAFLYFAYPTDISGSVWTYIGDATAIEGYSGATALAIASEASAAGNSVVQAFASNWDSSMYSLSSLFMGTVPGSIGETSTLMCLIGAAILIFTGVGSWKIILGVFGGAYATGLLFNALALNEYMAMPAEYHLVIGGLAFGAVFMATDPVTAAHTESAKWVYGILIGVLTVLIRVFNPAYPEGIMLAILFMNVMAPLLDYFVVEANKKRRLQRATV
ncbi:NADH:ubiquinone reductase (Na(+)-transporting) subunit B [Cytophagales bacterium LB-30]|uniref:Na(+)-translocating NADH-quinone reductase subunit B n=1 Tax=Shiella aurantiaca TaxID=3058365 RepID=A0ABT8F7T1_9BACT|nr:NADH:ubiquinone reductase (Na(+)-transporting) subunit B [Shiella aurantiaca]MDN4166537.1 NADH:ubiquinone reductase (Na(+)-transporting) subunit B [Shiella aurantiaca]